MEDTLCSIIAMIQATNQIDLSVYDQYFLEKSLQHRFLAVGALTANDYLTYISNNDDEIRDLISSLQIGYTQFFREPLTYAYLEETLLPTIIASKPDNSEIRIWSAGCSTGQEPYSIAILIQELLAVSQKKLRFRILGTDNAESSLDQAKKGIYSENAIQNIKIRYLDACFTKRGIRYVISDQIKQSVQFAPYDLLDSTTANPPESIYGNFDIIICSNVLIYYAHDLQQAIVNKLKQALSPNGYLITSESEKSLINSTSKLNMVMAPTTIFRPNKRGLAT